ncbi:Hypothetical predicted protein [Cloeon dipterum]|uniref:Major facilitator superfamily (MFS) profile domain-containing protein n=1 Tax=Cloeon dipterum TaxID=197152 RepID=A0A8S1BWB5_9INSE|nr:Hypothetical predicted protein [Cloeon dipterum]
MAKFTRAQKLTLGVFGFANFCNAICVSLQAPFYPKEAENKGATATEYGAVFAVFELIVFIVSPFLGKYMSVLGARRIYKVGIMTVATSSIIFGLLNKVEGRYQFISTCLVVRMIEAMGNAAFLTSSFAIIAQEFPGRVATTFASLEMCFGIGMIAGPTVGGALYDVGGYTTPFVVMGCILYIAGFVAFYVLPQASKVETKGVKSISLIEVLKVPAIAADVFSITVTAFGLGFTQATLEPHLRQFNLSAIMLGVFFVINGALYAVTSPFFGWLCDNYFQPKIITVIGCLLNVAGFMLLGPAPFLPFETRLWVCAVAQVLHGMGMAAQLVSTFSDALQEAFKHGCPDSEETHGLICGLWASTFAFGSFVGPLVGGILLDHVGFRSGSVVVMCLNILVAIVLIIYTVINRRQRSYYEDLSASQKIKNIERSISGGGMVNSLSLCANHCKYNVVREYAPELGLEPLKPGYGTLYTPQSVKWCCHLLPIRLLLETSLKQVNNAELNSCAASHPQHSRFQEVLFYLSLWNCGNFNIIARDRHPRVPRQSGVCVCIFTNILGISYCICILALFILPQYRTSPREIRSLSRGTTAFMTKRSIFSLNSFSITLASCGLVFVQENMEFHFLKLGEFMSLISTINQILTTSALLIISGWLLRGKYDFFQFKKAKWIYGIGHALLGIGAATNLVVLFVDEIQQALNKGCPHSMLTYGLICGVWLSDFMFGYFYGVFIADRNFLKDVEKSIAFLALIFLYIILVISLSVKMSNYYKTTIPSKIKTKKKDRSFSLDLSENMRLLNHEV